MKPADVTTQTTELADGRVLETWTRTKNGQPIAVSFLPSTDPGIRNTQEADLARSLEARTPP